MALTDKLKAIADAIRAKAGTTGSMTLAQMPQAISNIETGITPAGTIDITENGTYDVTDKASAVVNVASSGGGANEPYIEETYDKNENLIHAKLVGHKYVRGKAFTNCSKLESVDLPSGLNRIKDESFNSCSSLISIKLPSEITSIGINAFASCNKLGLTELPSGLTTIGDSAFNGAKVLITKIPSGVTKIGNFAFNFCLDITSLTFEGTPMTIYAKSFNGCSNITTINVPWAEGAVANAPWGATNATINYNYTGG